MTVLFVLLACLCLTTDVQAQPTAGLGDSCHSHSTCYSTHCDMDRYGINGHCTRGGIRGGQACSHPGREDECYIAFYCGQAASSSPAACLAKKGVNAACDSDVECASGSCHGGQCASRRALNERCTSNLDCFSRNCQSRTCQRGPRDEASPCTYEGRDDECRRGLWCTRYNPALPPACRPKRETGQACSSNTECLDNDCRGTCQGRRSLKQACNFDTDCYSAVCRGICFRGTKVEGRPCAHLGRDDEAARHGFYCSLNAAGAQVMTLKTAVTGMPCSYNAECTTNFCQNRYCATTGHDDVLSVCPIVNVNAYSISDAHVEEIIAYTSDMLWDRAGMRLRALRPVHRITSGDGFSSNPSQGSSAVNVCYTQHVNDPANAVFAITGNISAGSTHSYVIVSDNLSDQGYCNRVYSPWFGSAHVYGGDFSPTQGNGNSRTMSTRIILAQLFTHELAHSFGIRGNSDHLGESQCQAVLPVSIDSPYLRPRGWESMCPYTYNNLAHARRLDPAHCLAESASAGHVNGVSCGSNDDCNSRLCVRGQCFASNLAAGEFCLMHVQCASTFCFPWLTCR